jgi:hypothetical protein
MRDLEKKITKYLEGLNKQQSLIWVESEGEYTNFILFHPSQLEEEQYGYNKSESGESLIGDNSGDWKDGWIVIGYSEYLNDPLFVDAKNSDLPIYTAAHGMGSWEPILLYSTWEQFKHNQKDNF